ncbi:MAG: MoaD/ThiS family protein [Balneolaceae bacterium]|nr:MAG: MoaD/ThiS family protein [Balneolaceae bacterium]
MQKEEILEQEKALQGNSSQEKATEAKSVQGKTVVDKSISVNLLWFSVLADHRGRRSEQLSLPAGARGSDLIDRLSDEMPIVRKYRDYIRLAVNQEYVDAARPLHHGDEIALITPVSGG